MANMKNTVVGVSVTSERGLEVAQIDYATKTVINYASKMIDYDKNRNIISDMDIFKDSLMDLFSDLAIPKGANVVLTLPPTLFGLRDYPASMNMESVRAAVEDELNESPIFQNADDVPHYACAKLSNSTIQMSKIVYTSVSRTQAIEIAIMIRDLGYRLRAIDTSINSTLNALMYSEKVDVQLGNNWVMLIIENNLCRVIPISGRDYVDYFEEKVSIGEVLGDAENYDTIVTALNPILSRVPSQLLYVISKTDIINAEVLAQKLAYNAQIVHLNANVYSQNCLIEPAADMNPNVARMISLDVIGASIRQSFNNTGLKDLDLFNIGLGDIYTSQVPPTFAGIELSMRNMLFCAAIFALIVAGIAFGINKNYVSKIEAKDLEIKQMNEEIAQINRYLEENKNISSSSFSEANEIKVGVARNQNVYSYFKIVESEIPVKLWLTYLAFGDNTTIEGRSANLESVYSFFRNIKEYNPESALKLQKLTLAADSDNVGIASGGEFDTESVLTSLNADYYEFKMSDGAEVPPASSQNTEKKSAGMLTDIPDADLN